VDALAQLLFTVFGVLGDFRYAGLLRTDSEETVHMAHCTNMEV